jgi:hypothetical protein
MNMGGIMRFSQKDLHITFEWFRDAEGFEFYAERDKCGKI